MTKKQIKTILLFAQNYSLQVIAKKMGVSLTTIRERIKSLSKHHSKEFGNAMALRESYKRIRDGLRSPASLECLLVAKKAKGAAKQTAFGAENFISRPDKEMDDIKDTF